MDTMKSDVFNYVLQEFQVSLDKITHRCFQVFFYLLWYSRKHQAVPHAAGLELDDSFFDFFLFSSESEGIHSFFEVGVFSSKNSTDLHSAWKS